MKILYITHSLAYKTNTVFDYDSSFSRYSRHSIYYFDIALNKFDIDLSCFDIIIFSYAFAAYTRILSPKFKETVRSFKGPKIIFLQDEYTNFIKHRDNLKDLEINAIVTVMPEKHWNDIFGADLAEVPKLQVLTGYVPEHMATMYDSRLPLSDRKWHIGYRSRSLGPIFGRLVREKVEIGRNMKKLCRERHVPANIEVAEEKRIYGRQWLEFIKNCKVMLGTESGCNVFDFDGAMAKAIKAYEKAHPDADFDEIHANCIGNAEGRIKTNQISPRIFEAACLGTGHILYEGEYSGILIPWRHYIPLKKNYSNVDEVFDALEDMDLLEKMLANSHRDLVASGTYSYKAFINRVDAFLEGLGNSGLPSSLFPLLPRRPPVQPDADFKTKMQALENTRARRLGKKYAGKRIFAYGGGAAFNTYASFFARSHIAGIILDDYFLAGDLPASDIPFLGIQEALEKIRDVDGCVIFCRPEFVFDMNEKARTVFDGLLAVDTCVLYS